MPQDLFLYGEKEVRDLMSRSDREAANEVMVYFSVGTLVFLIVVGIFLSIW